MWRGWIVACLIGCSWAQPAKQEMGKMYMSQTKQSDLESSASGYVFKNVPAEKYAKIIEESLEGLEDFGDAPASVAPASAAKSRSDAEFLPLPLGADPEAEMLPVHYTGLKPPGVDHMELTFLEPVILSSNRKSTLVEGSAEADAAPTTQVKALDFVDGAGKQFAAAQQAARGAQGEKGYKKAEVFDEGKKGQSAKENQKGEYAEAAGARKAHSGRENHYTGHKDAAAAEKGASFEIEGSHAKGRNNKGFHNVYHKDEYKKDSDFYDSDQKGGHFKKHGRYGENHAVLEGAYDKGGSSDSGFAQAEAAKEGKAEKGRSQEEAQGHAAKEGYGGFFGNFEEFAKKSGAAEGKKYGFSSGDSGKAR
ncbi:uncharacterized protein LOC107273736 [Cephus cinctus]|uniref:Uncharacterized protein LOC107273736 n=1 Tax=Cephus cinctus TaxID=211228 RepID=A0AAJ7FTM6_CEPCN|nr:uncharacterized protein LOC107273736 [Cephus cinctus]